MNDEKKFRDNGWRGVARLRDVIWNNEIISRRRKGICFLLLLFNERQNGSMEHSFTTILFSDFYVVGESRICESLICTNVMFDLLVKNPVKLIYSQAE